MSNEKNEEEKSWFKLTTQEIVEKIFPEEVIDFFRDLLDDDDEEETK